MFVTGAGIYSNSIDESSSHIGTWFCGHQQRNGEIGEY